MDRDVVFSAFIGVGYSLDVRLNLLSTTHYLIIFVQAWPIPQPVVFEM